MQSQLSSSSDAAAAAAASPFSLSRYFSGSSSRSRAAHRSALSSSSAASATHGQAAAASSSSKGAGKLRQLTNPALVGVNFLSSAKQKPTTHQATPKNRNSGNKKDQHQQQPPSAFHSPSLAEPAAAASGSTSMQQAPLQPPSKQQASASSDLINEQEGLEAKRQHLASRIEAASLQLPSASGDLLAQLQNEAMEAHCEQLPICLELIDMELKIAKMQPPADSYQVADSSTSNLALRPSMVQTWAQIAQQDATAVIVAAQRWMKVKAAQPAAAAAGGAASQQMPVAFSSSSAAAAAAASAAASASSPLVEAAAPESTSAAAVGDGAPSAKEAELVSQLRAEHDLQLQSLHAKWTELWSAIQQAMQQRLGEIDSAAGDASPPQVEEEQQGQQSPPQLQPELDQPAIDAATLDVQVLMNEFTALMDRLVQALQLQWQKKLDDAAASAAGEARELQQKQQKQQEAATAAAAEVKATLDKEIGELNTRLNEAKQAAAVAKKESAGLAAARIASEATIQQLNSTIEQKETDAEARLTELKKQLQQQQQQQQQSSSAIEPIRTQLEDATSRLTELESQLRQRDRDLQQEQLQRQSHSEQLQSATAKVNALQSQLDAAAQANASKVGKLNQEWDAKMEEITAERDAALRQLAEAKQELEAAAAKVAAAEKSATVQPALATPLAPPPQTPSLAAPLAAAAVAAAASAIVAAAAAAQPPPDLDSLSFAFSRARPVSSEAQAEAQAASDAVAVAASLPSHTAASSGSLGSDSSSPRLLARALVSLAVISEPERRMEEQLKNESLLLLLLLSKSSNGAAVAKLQVRSESKVFATTPLSQLQAVDIRHSSVSHSAAAAAERVCGRLLLLLTRCVNVSASCLCVAVSRSTPSHCSRITRSCGPTASARAAM